MDLSVNQAYSFLRNRRLTEDLTKEIQDDFYMIRQPLEGSADGLNHPSSIIHHSSSTALSATLPSDSKQLYHNPQNSTVHNPNLSDSHDLYISLNPSVNGIDSSQTNEFQSEAGGPIECQKDQSGDGFPMMLPLPLP